MLLRFENNSMSILLLALIQLLSSFAMLQGLELPLELLHDGVNLPKSSDYARRLSFPLASSDVVEMPPNVEDNLDFSSNGAGGGDDNDMDMDDDLTGKTKIPKWFQMQLQQEQQQQQQHQHQHQQHLLQMEHKNYQAALQQKTPKHKHHHSQHQMHSSSSSSSSAAPLRRCSIEISSKIPGICQSLGSIGNTCVSGDYIDVYNAECL